MQTAARVTIVASVVAVSALGAAYILAGRIPELRSPITIDSAVFLPDGGSCHIVLRDAAGTSFAFGVSGSLDRSKTDFPVYVQRWYPQLPIPHYVLKGSTKENSLISALEAWAKSNSISDQDRSLLLERVAFLRARSASYRSASQT